VQERCRRETPEMQPIAVGHEAACHFVDEIPSIDLASSGR
jgi:hypothetical protein